MESSGAVEMMPLKTYAIGDIHGAYKALAWDRRLLDMAWKKQVDGHKCQLGKYKDIFVGHTTTEFYNTLQPIHVCNVWNIDTGAGWSGKLTIMDVDTKEYWQADLTPDLYGGTPDKL